jgi:hypothetical protein
MTLENQENGATIRVHERSPANATTKGEAMKSQAETIAELNARCGGPNQFEKFDQAFRHSLTVPKAALLKEEAKIKRARARKRAKKND